MEKEVAEALLEDMFNLFVKYELTYGEIIDLCEEMGKQVEVLAQCQRFS